jgi:hypothetical protein
MWYSAYLEEQVDVGVEAGDGAARGEEGEDLRRFRDEKSTRLKRGKMRTLFAPFEPWYRFQVWPPSDTLLATGLQRLFMIRRN